jgi:hypothetical protein
MPVPMDVMEKAAQGDKQAMRLVEKEYGVGNGQDFAIEQLSVEYAPPIAVPVRIIQTVQDNKELFADGRDKEGNLSPERAFNEAENIAIMEHERSLDPTIIEMRKKREKANMDKDYQSVTEEFIKQKTREEIEKYLKERGL